MRTPLLLLAVAGLPGLALAQSVDASSNFVVGGNVPLACAVGAPSPAAGRQVNFSGLNGSALQIVQLVDPATFSTNAASIELRFESVCNLRHRLRVETQNNGLWPTSALGAPSASGFATAIPYRARVSWAAQNFELNADAISRRLVESSVLVDGAAGGDIMVRLEIDRGATNARANAPLVAGIYGDTLRIIVEPQQ